MSHQAFAESFLASLVPGFDLSNAAYLGARDWLVAVTNAAVNASATTVTLTLASAVIEGQAVTLAYTTSAGNDVDAVSISATSVANATPDITGPVFASAAVNGSTLVMTYTELNR